MLCAITLCLLVADARSELIQPSLLSGKRIISNIPELFRNPRKATTTLPDNTGLATDQTLPAFASNEDEFETESLGVETSPYASDPPEFFPEVPPRFPYPQPGFPDQPRGFTGHPPGFPVNERYLHDKHHLMQAHPPFYDTGPDPPDPGYPVQHAGLPRSLAVYPKALENSYHELKFNVSWEQPLGPPAREYSIEITSTTETVDCTIPMCYEYNIPGNVWWWEVPSNPSHVAETCAVHPGCTYNVRLIAHPWDGHTAANLKVALDECVAGVCSCGHAPRLPVPRVSARTVSIGGEIFVNVSWVTPRPQYPQRLPPGLRLQRYAVSIGKQMVSDAHPAPWFANTVTRLVDANVVVADGDTPQWLVVPVTERSDKRGGKTMPIVLDVRLIARVRGVDDRGCIGPDGDATAYDPAVALKTSRGTYIMWAVFGGLCVIAMGVLVAASARVVKRVLSVFRPAPVSAPLEPLSCRPAWFMQSST